MKRAAGTLALAAAFAGVAHAEPGGTSSVSGVAITQGAIKLEARTAVFNGGEIDGDWAHRIQANYNPTSWWRSQINVRANQPDGEDAELRNIGWENAVDFTDTREWPVRLGGQFEYRWGQNGATDSIEFKLLTEHRAENFNARFNLIVGRAVGDDTSDEWNHGYSARAYWTVAERYQLGGEAFGELDIDANAWGPRAGIILGDATISAAYLASFGDDADADGQVRLVLEFTP